MFIDGVDEVKGDGFNVEVLIGKYREEKKRWLWFGRRRRKR